MMLRHVPRKFARRPSPISMLFGSPPRSMKDATAVKWRERSERMDIHSARITKDTVIKQFIILFEF